MHTTPPAGHISHPPVQWFGASTRLIGEAPDSRYGWLEHGGEVCIVKAMSTDLSAHSASLLAHERQMLQRLKKMNAPAPEMLNLGHPDWLVTRFAGLSLQRLTHAGGLQGSAPLQRFGFAERLSAWVHLLRRLHPVADAGVLAIDLYSANVVLPLTNGTHGQLCLHEAAMIDHAHTLVAGLDIRRPVLINHTMDHIAPELIGALKADLAQLTAAYSRAGSALPKQHDLEANTKQLNRRIWAEYDAQQQLQVLLDNGRIDPHLSMQYAAGIALRRMIQLAESKKEFEQVVQRMTAFNASDRFKKLSHAADALADIVKALPLMSAHTYMPLQPHDLALPTMPAPAPAPVTPDNPVKHTDTSTQTQPAYELMHNTPQLRKRWLYAAAALGAAWGTFYPLPWGG